MGSPDFYSPEELRALGATSVGRNVQVSRLARFYEFSGRIGDFCRIDDFCTLKGQVELGAMVHVAAYTMLGGSGAKIIMGDFSGLAAYVAVYTANSLYSGLAPTSLFANPATPPDLRGESSTGDVLIGKGAGCGVHCLVLPGAIIQDYAFAGPHSTVKGTLETGGVYFSGAGRLRKISTRDVAQLKEAEIEAYRRLEL